MPAVYICTKAYSGYYMWTRLYDIYTMIIYKYTPQFKLNFRY